MQGTVTDLATKKPVFFATVVNLNTSETVSTGADGRFSISAHRDDAISITYIGYSPVQRLATPGADFRVELEPLGVQLNDFIAHPNYTPFQRDSLEMASRYGKELNTQPLKPKIGLSNGVEADGLIGAAVQKMSRSYKRNKKFKQQFQSDEEQKYIDTRYSPGLVTAITGFTGDTVSLFMNTYPMDYNFARVATDLEIQMWVRDNYKDYLHQGILPSPARDIK